MFIGTRTTEINRTSALRTAFGRSCAASACAALLACTPLKSDLAPFDAGIDAVLSDADSLNANSLNADSSDADSSDGRSIDADSSLALEGGGDAKPLHQNFALAFDGDAYGIVHGATDLRLQDLTIELYANFDVGGKAMNLVSRPFGSGAADSFALWFQSSTLYAGANVTDTVDALGIQVPNLELHWVHLAMTFDHTTGEEALFVDGVLKQTHVTKSPIDYDDSDFFVGADTYNLHLEAFFLGSLDEIRVWSVVRSANDIQASMDSPLRGDETGLEAYWPLDEGAGQTAADATGHGHTLQLGKSALPETEDPQWVVSSAPIASKP